MASPTTHQTTSDTCPLGCTNGWLPITTVLPAWIQPANRAPLEPFRPICPQCFGVPLLKQQIELRALREQDEVVDFGRFTALGDAFRKALLKAGYDGCECYMCLLPMPGLPAVADHEEAVRLHEDLSKRNEEEAARKEEEERRRREEEEERRRQEQEQKLQDPFVLTLEEYEVVTKVEDRPTSEEALDALPRKSFARASGANKNKECTVCLGDFTDDTEVVELPCKHVLCADECWKWLRKRNSWPLCRHLLPAAPPSRRVWARLGHGDDAADEYTVQSEDEDSDFDEENWRPRNGSMALAICELPWAPRGFYPRIAGCSH